MNTIKTQIVRSPLPVANLTMSSTASIQSMCWLGLIVSASECPNLQISPELSCYDPAMSLPSLSSVLQLAYGKNNYRLSYVSVSSRRPVLGEVGGSFRTKWWVGVQGPVAPSWAGQAILVEPAIVASCVPTIGPIPCRSSLQILSTPHHDLDN